MNLLYKAATLAVCRRRFVLLRLYVVPFAKDTAVIFATTFLLPSLPLSRNQHFPPSSIFGKFCIVSDNEGIVDLAKRPGIPNDLSRNNLSRSWSSPRDQSIRVTVFRFPQRALGGRD